MRPAGLPILTYHAIDASGAVTATDPSRFAETLAALRESGHLAVDLAGWVAAGRPDLDRAFAVCFDDGLASILGVADLLIRDAVPATIFLVANRIGLDNAWPGQLRGIPRARLLDRSELGNLAARGFRLGSHGRTHARLDRLSPSDLRGELKGSREAIEQALGRACPLLAHPYGASDARVREAAAEVYNAAFGTRLAHGSSKDDRFAISRIDAYYLRSPRALAALIEGRWQRGLAVRRAMRAARRSLPLPDLAALGRAGNPARPATRSPFAAGFSGRPVFEPSSSGVP